MSVVVRGCWERASERAEGWDEREGGVRRRVRSVVAGGGMSVVADGDILWRFFYFFSGHWVGSTKEEKRKRWTLCARRNQEW